MIYLDTSQLLNLSKQLKEVNRSAFPIAVRSTLNEAAFDVKNRTLSISTKENFTIRQPSLFKRYSGVEKAQGWEVEKMHSTVGMMPGGQASKTVERFKEQEEGGQLNTPFIPDDVARVGGLHKGKVLKNKWIGKVNKVATVPFGNKQALIKAVTKTGVKSGGKGKGFGVLYGNILYEIKGFKRFRDTNTIELHLDRMYLYRKKKTSFIKPTHFVKEAGLNSGKEINKIFALEAEKQLKKYMK